MKRSPSKPPRQAAKAGTAPVKRSVRRDRIRSELIAIGMEHFKKRGYDQTTINDIVAATGLSSRTFFRYFKSKDDLVFDWMDRQGEFVRPLLEARPASESPLQAMEYTFLQLAAHHDGNRRQTHLLTHLVFDTPALAGRYHHEHAKWEDEFVNILLRARHPGAAEEFALRVQVSAAITTFVTAIRSWAGGQRKDPLQDWVAQAYVALRSAIAARSRS